MGNKFNMGERPYLDLVGTFIPPRFTGPSDIRVYAKQGYIGDDVVLLSDLGRADSPIEFLHIGDGVRIGEGCNISVPRLVIGDYTKLHRNSLVYGRNPLKIGYNCWMGEGSVIDCEGKVTIGNGVCIGTHSQLWSHIRHGDLLEGCRYLSYGELTVEDDVWFASRSLVSPIHAKAKSMSLPGSVVTHDMESNHIYGGVPAIDLTEKLGAPFNDVPVQTKFEMMADRLLAFYEAHPEYPTTIILTDKWLDSLPEMSQFNVSTRTYRKQNTMEERAFMRALLPEVKFTPAGGVLP